jgi:hypothetical protein
MCISLVLAYGDTRSSTSTRAGRLCASLARNACASSSDGRDVQGVRTETTSTRR